MRRVLWIAVVALLVGAFLWLRLWISQLEVSASHTTLRMGDSVQLAVTMKTWFGTKPLIHPERTQYISNWESMAVVEPDGKVTAVGTWGQAKETTNVMAFNGSLKGSVRFSLRGEGPGPTLDFVVEAPDVLDMHTATCCSTPVRVMEGQQVRFRVSRRDPQHTEVTRRIAGTRYTLFFGSGVPNDANPAQIIGYGQGINPASFRVDDARGMITAPASIGGLNHFTVLVFARNGAEVGWKQIRLVHAAAALVQ